MSTANQIIKFALENPLHYVWAATGGWVLCEDIVHKMKDKKIGVTVKNRRRGLRTYEACFIGNEMINWLMEYGYAHPGSRTAAVIIAEQLWTLGLIHHVREADEQDSLDDAVLFRFSNAVENRRSIQSLLQVQAQPPQHPPPALFTKVSKRNHALAVSMPKDQQPPYQQTQPPQNSQSQAQSQPPKSHHSPPLPHNSTTTTTTSNTSTTTTIPTNKTSTTSATTTASTTTTTTTTTTITTTTATTKQTNSNQSKPESFNFSPRMMVPLPPLPQNPSQQHLQLLSQTQSQSQSQPSSTTSAQPPSQSPRSPKNVKRVKPKTTHPSIFNISDESSSEQIGTAPPLAQIQPPQQKPNYDQDPQEEDEDREEDNKKKQKQAKSFSEDDSFDEQIENPPRALRKESNNPLPKRAHSQAAIHKKQRHASNKRTHASNDHSTQTTKNNNNNHETDKKRSKQTERSTSHFNVREKPVSSSTSGPDSLAEKHHNVESKSPRQQIIKS